MAFLVSGILVLNVLLNQIFFPSQRSIATDWWMFFKTRKLTFWIDMYTYLLIYFDRPNSNESQVFTLQNSLKIFPLTRYDVYFCSSKRFFQLSYFCLPRSYTCGIGYGPKHHIDCSCFYNMEVFPAKILSR